MKVMIPIDHVTCDKKHLSVLNQSFSNMVITDNIDVLAAFHCFQTHIGHSECIHT